MAEKTIQQLLSEAYVPQAPASLAHQSTSPSAVRDGFVDSVPEQVATAV